MQNYVTRDTRPPPNVDETTWPVLICLLGPFRLLEAGRPITVHSDSKVAALLSILAVRAGQDIARETLLALLWPDSPADLAGQALSTLIYKLSRRRTRGLHDAPLILHTYGAYRLNAAAGVTADVTLFDALADSSEAQFRAGDPGEATLSCERALNIYHGDLHTASDDTYAMAERERLRGRYLTLLARLAAYRYQLGDDTGCLAYAQRLLAHDSCREDAHRLVMRCYARQGARGQALRQYHLCARPATRVRRPAGARDGRPVRPTAA